MDRREIDRRADQMNPNNTKTGPGHEAAYQGDRSKANIDNHAQQLNPNNPKYQAPKK